MAVSDEAEEEIRENLSKHYKDLPQEQIEAMVKFICKNAVVLVEAYIKTKQNNDLST